MHVRVFDFPIREGPIVVAYGGGALKRMSVLSEFLRDDSGAAAAEYALILAFIAGVLVLSIGSLITAIANVVTVTAGLFAS